MTSAPTTSTSIWPFNGEYWRDELGYYRFKIVNKCRRSAPEGAPSTGESAAPAGGGAAARRWGAPAREPVRTQ